VSIHQTIRRHITDDNNLLKGAIDHYYSLKSPPSAGNFISSLGNNYILSRGFREIAKSLSYLSVCPFVPLPDCTEQLCSQRKDFHGILYLSIFLKSVEKIQVSLKSDLNNSYVLYMKTIVHL